MTDSDAVHYEHYSFYPYATVFSIKILTYNNDIDKLILLDNSNTCKHDNDRHKVMLLDNIPTHVNCIVFKKITLNI